MEEIFITEDYISFEVAVLLKEKGFNWHCEHCYEVANDNPYSNANYQVSYPKPTHQMALKWLRDVHGIRIGIVPYYFEDSGEDGWIVEIDGTGMDGNTPFDALLVFKKYEEATEKALKYCLKHFDDLV